MLLKVLQWVFWLVGLGLQGLVILTLFNGPWREFPALFAYIASLVATTLGEILTFNILGKKSAYANSYYWSAELIRQTALFGLVVSLSVHALPQGRKTEAYGRLLALAAIMFWTTSALLHYSPVLDVWMTGAVRDMSFMTGILNLLAWFAYARAGCRDTTRLMISGGLGLQMTGEAIGQAIRQMGLSTQVTLAASIFIVITHFICLYIWWRALTSYSDYSARAHG